MTIDEARKHVAKHSHYKNPTAYEYTGGVSGVRPEIHVLTSGLCADSVREIASHPEFAGMQGDPDGKLVICFAGG